MKPHDPLPQEALDSLKSNEVDEEEVSFLKPHDPLPQEAINNYLLKSRDNSQNQDFDVESFEFIETDDEEEEFSDIENQLLLDPYHPDAGFM